jgi:hypothetical protein
MPRTYDESDEDAMAGALKAREGWQIAKAGCCEEAAIGMPGYFPCNKPAVHMVGWPARKEGPYRMCAMCADHNVRHRGAVIVGPYAKETTP